MTTSTYVDPISMALDADTPIATSIAPVVQEHTVTDDFEEKVRQFRAQMATNATLDYKDSRENMRQLIAHAMEIMPDVLAAVEETRSDKAIFAMNDFLKTVTHMNKELVNLNSSVTKQSGKTTTPDKQQAAQEQANVASHNQTIVMVGGAQDVFKDSAESVNSRFQIDEDIAQ